MRRLTVEHEFLDAAKFVAFFESASHFHLATELVEGCTFKSFVATAHRCIADGKLSRSEFMRAVKLIMMRLINAVRRLHEDHHCIFAYNVPVLCFLYSCSALRCVHVTGSHGNLSTENVLIQDVAFEEDAQGDVRIVGEMLPKLIDFGMAQLMETVTGPAASTASYFRPHHGPEASLLPMDSVGPAEQGVSWKTSDVWALGVVFFECVVGAPLYETWRNDENGAYFQIHRGKLAHYMADNDLIHLFREGGEENGAFSLLLGLLDVEPERRFTATKAANHPWFE